METDRAANNNDKHYQNSRRTKVMVTIKCLNVKWKPDPTDSRAHGNFLNTISC